MSEQTRVQERPAPPKRRRGRESAGDMVRSLAVVMIVVGVLFYFAQASPSDRQTLRVVDPTADVRGFAAGAPGVPVPGPLPGWRPTVTELLATPARLRVGYSTPSGSYAEYAAVSGPPGSFVDDATGRAPAGAPLTVGARSFQQRRNAAGALSLVLTGTRSTVVVGGLRNNASLQELRVLAASLVPAASGP